MLGAEGSPSWRRQGQGHRMWSVNELHFSFATAAPPPDSPYWGTQGTESKRCQGPKHRKRARRKDTREELGKQEERVQIDPAAEHFWRTRQHVGRGVGSSGFLSLPLSTPGWEHSA